MTMTIVFALIGLLLGGVIAEFGGAFGGAALGYVIGLHLEFKRRFEAVEDELARLAREGFSAQNLPTPAPERSWQPPPPRITPREPAAPAAASAAAEKSSETWARPPEEPELLVWVRNY